MSALLNTLLRLLRRLSARLEWMDDSDAASTVLGRRLRLVFAFAFVMVAVVLAYQGLQQGELPGPLEILVLTFAAALAVNRMGRFLRDWAPVCFILLAYLVAFGLVSHFKFPVFYTPQLDADKVIGLGHLPTAVLQGWVGQPSLALEAVCVAAYVSHFLFPVLLGCYLWFRRSAGFRELMYADIAVSALAGVIQVLIPTAPPWLAAQHGLAPGVHDVLRQALSDVGLGDLARLKGDGHAYNVVAAFPSIHAAFPVVGLIVARRARVPRWLLIAQVAQLAAVWLVIVYTGEHYLIDVVGGAICAVAAWRFTVWVLAVRERWVAGRNTRPTPSPPEVVAGAEAQRSR